MFKRNRPSIKTKTGFGLRRKIFPLVLSLLFLGLTTSGLRAQCSVTITVDDNSPCRGQYSMFTVSSPCGTSGYTFQWSNGMTGTSIVIPATSVEGCISVTMIDNSTGNVVGSTNYCWLYPPIDPPVLNYTLSASQLNQLGFTYEACDGDFFLDLSNCVGADRYYLSITKQGGPTHQGWITNMFGPANPPGSNGRIGPMTQVDLNDFLGEPLWGLGGVFNQANRFSLDPGEYYTIKIAIGNTCELWIEETFGLAVRSEPDPTFTLPSNTFCEDDDIIAQGNEPGISGSNVNIRRWELVELSQSGNPIMSTAIMLAPNNLGNINAPNLHNAYNYQPGKCYRVTQVMYSECNDGYVSHYEDFCIEENTCNITASFTANGVAYTGSPLIIVPPTSSTVTFQSTSSTSPLGTFSYYWDFGFGNPGAQNQIGITGTPPPVSFTFSNMGPHTITLTVVGEGCGGSACYDTYTYEIFMEGGNTPPINCDELPLQLELRTETWGCNVAVEGLIHGLTHNPYSGSISSFDFNDPNAPGTIPGTTMALNHGTSSNPVWKAGHLGYHTFTESGTYTICWTYTYVTQGGRCTETVCTDVTVECDPVSCTVDADFDYWTATHSPTVPPSGFFTSLCGIVAQAHVPPSSAIPSKFVTYTFDWGDGTTTGPQRSPIAGHAYALPNLGGYNVTVTLNSGFWCNDSETENGIVIYQGCGPRIGLSPDESALESDDLVPLVYPNPFNGSTSIQFNLPEDRAEVGLQIFNSLGQPVATLAKDLAFPAGKHELIFQANQLAAGSYYFVFTTEKERKTGTLILME